LRVPAENNVGLDSSGKNGTEFETAESVYSERSKKWLIKIFL